MIDLTIVEGLKAAASAWPGGRPLYVEAFGRRMVAGEAAGDNGTIVLRLKDDGTRPSFEDIVAIKDGTIDELAALLVAKDAQIAALQPKPDATPSQPGTDADQG